MSLRPVEDLRSLRAPSEFEEHLAECGNALLLGQLARNLPHEINNPLSGVVGMLELLLQDAAPSSMEHELYGHAVAGCQHIRRVVDAISRVALEEAQSDQNVHLEEVITDTVQLIRLTTAAKDVEIIERIGAGPWVVRGSHVRLKQVFAALLVNAQDAMPEGGAVTIELAREANWLVATVSDTGPGIDAALLEEVFEPFMSSRMNRGRAGLGLSLGRAVARAHGGDLRARPDGGPGACLELVLPASA
jgi:two-component system, NtrC family, sensor kinase